MQSGNYSFDAMADMPADFGPDVPTEGITAPLWVCSTTQLALLLPCSGDLFQRHICQGPTAQVADPEDACQPIRPPPKAAEGFIALIQRSEELSADCSFDVKVCTHPQLITAAALQPRHRLRFADWAGQQC